LTGPDSLLDTTAIRQEFTNVLVPAMTPDLIDAAARAYFVRMSPATGAG